MKIFGRLDYRKSFFIVLTLLIATIVFNIGVKYGALRQSELDKKNNPSFRPTIPDQSITGEIVVTTKTKISIKTKTGTNQIIVNKDTSATDAAGKSIKVSNLKVGQQIVADCTAGERNALTATRIRVQK